MDTAGGALQRAAPLGERRLEARSGSTRIRYREDERYYGIVRDFFKAAQRVWGDAWGHDSYMVTKPVTLKAMIRVCADLARNDAEPGRRARQRAGSSGSCRGRTTCASFASEGFYERFPAKGQIERVARIHRDLAKMAHIEVRARGREQ